MANRYYVGPAAGAWNLNANWSAASGGAGGASFPIAGDNAFLDAGSAGNGPTLTVAAACDQLDCTGFTGALDLGGFALTIAKTVFKLVAGMTLSAGAANPALDFTAVAGAVAITSAGKDLGSIRCGNAGAGGTYQLQDALAVLRDVDLVNGTFQFNNQNAVISRDLLLKATLAAASVVLGSGTIEIRRNIDSLVANAINAASAGTSTVKLTGDGGIIFHGATTITFYRLEIASAGKTTTFSQLAAAHVNCVVVQGLKLQGGAVTVAGAFLNYFDWLMVNFLSTSDPTLVDAVATTTCQCPIRVFGQTGAVGTFTLNLPSAMSVPGTYVTSPPLSLGFTGLAVPSYLKLGRVVSITGNLYFLGAVAPAASGYFDLNGFNLTVSGIMGTPSGYAGLGVIVGNATLSIGQDFVILGTGVMPAYTTYILDISAGGTVAIGRDLLVTSAIRNTIKLLGTLAVGRNWDTSIMPGWFFAEPDAGTVQFTAAGPFTIAAYSAERWPTVNILGGGSITLPNGFNCYNLIITAGLVTAGNPLIVRNVLNNNGTINLGSNPVYIGGGFINTGTVNGLATANVLLYGALVRLSGFNPITLTMYPTCSRLQLESAMNITTFIILDRPTPGIVYYLAGATFNIGTFNSQISAPDGCVQFVSSVPGLAYKWRVTVLTSLANIWPRDNDASTSPVPPVGGLSNRDLGNNIGWTLNTKGLAKLITDDVGTDQLAANNIGPFQYCWLVGTSVVNLTAIAAAFAAGANNWHRKTNIPFAILDNLKLGSTYYFAIGLLDDRNRRQTPNVVGGDYTSLLITQGESGGGGGGGHKSAVASSKTPWPG